MPAPIALPASSVARIDARYVEPIGYQPTPGRAPLIRYAAGPCPRRNKYDPSMETAPWASFAITALLPSMSVDGAKGSRKNNFTFLHES